MSEHGSTVRSIAIAAFEHEHEAVTCQRLLTDAEIYAVIKMSAEGGLNEQGLPKVFVLCVLPESVLTTRAILSASRVPWFEPPNSAPDAPYSEAPQGAAYLLLAGVSGLLMSTAVYMRASDALGASGTYELFAFVLTVLGTFIGLIGWVFKRNPKSAQRRREHRARDIADKLTRGLDPGDFALYLRPFKTEGFLIQSVALREVALIPLAKRIETIELEHLLAIVFDDVGIPLVALGGPGTGFGSGYIATDDVSWTGVISPMLDAATAVILLPGVSPGTCWELQYLIRKGHLQKTLFVMPKENSSVDWKEYWRSASEAATEIGLKLPPYETDGRIFSMESVRDVDLWKSLRGRQTIRTIKRSLNPFIRKMRRSA
jgi:hypothetical protein